MHKNITGLFCFVDDYCKIIGENFASRLLGSVNKILEKPYERTNEI